MAKWKLNPMAESVRRKIGNLVFWPLPSGRVISRSRVIPANPQTQYQDVARDALAIASGVWAATSSAERDTWTIKAAAYSRVDEDGNPYALNGRTLCTMVNYWRALDGLASITTFPAGSGTPPVFVTAVDGLERDLGGAGYTLYFRYGSTGNFKFVVRATKTLPGGRVVFQRSDYRLPTDDAADSIITKAIAAAGPNTLALVTADLRPGWDTDWQAAIASGAPVAVGILVLDEFYVPQILDFGVTNDFAVTQGV